MTTSARRARVWGDSSFRVLAVCRANHCRSPLMEHLLRAGAEARALPWQVSSSGIEATSGVPIHPYMGRILAKRGIATTEWLSQRLNPTLVADADLILTASESQRTQITALDADVDGRTFTMLAFARMARFARPTRRITVEEFGPWLVEEAARQGSRVVRLRSGPSDVDDPLGRPFSEFRKCTSIVDEACQEIFARCANPELEW